MDTFILLVDRYLLTNFPIQQYLQGIYRENPQFSSVDHHHTLPDSLARRGEMSMMEWKITGN
jgi:hypothetical protein